MLLRLPFIKNKPSRVIHATQPPLGIARPIQGKEIRTDDQGVIGIHFHFPPTCGLPVEQNRSSLIRG